LKDSNIVQVDVKVAVQQRVQAVRIVLYCAVTGKAFLEVTEVFLVDIVIFVEIAGPGLSSKAPDFTDGRTLPIDRVDPPIVGSISFQGAGIVTRRCLIVLVYRRFIGSEVDVIAVCKPDKRPA